MTPPVLLPAELAALTGKVRPSAQARELAQIGIRYTRRSDGTIVVFREDCKHAEEDGHAPQVLQQYARNVHLTS